MGPFCVAMASPSAAAEPQSAVVNFGPGFEAWIPAANAYQRYVVRRMEPTPPSPTQFARYMVHLARHKSLENKLVCTAPIGKG